MQESIRQLHPRVALQFVDEFAFCWLFCSGGLFFWSKVSFETNRRAAQLFSCFWRAAPEAKMTPPECNWVFVIKSTTSMVFACARVCLFSYFFAKALGGGWGVKMEPRWSKMEPRWAKMEEEGRRKKGTEGSKHQEERRDQNKEDLYTITPDHPALLAPYYRIYNR